MKKAERLQYTENSLLKYFTEYNECKNESFFNIHQKVKKDLFNFNVRPGINRSSLSIRNSFSEYDNTHFDSQFGIRFGLETEFILPVYGNKWSILIEPTYQSFNAQQEIEIESNFWLQQQVQTVHTDYKSIEIPIGVRYYFFLNEVSKIFVNAAFIIDITQNSTIAYEMRSDLNINSRNNFAFGLGYKIKDRYSVEYRYQTRREILGNYVYWKSDFNNMALIFGYTLF